MFRFSASAYPGCAQRHLPILSVLPLTSRCVRSFSTTRMRFANETSSSSTKNETGSNETSNGSGTTPNKVNTRSVQAFETLCVDIARSYNKFKADRNAARARDLLKKSQARFMNTADTPAGAVVDSGSSSSRHGEEPQPTVATLTLPTATTDLPFLRAGEEEERVTFPPMRVALVFSQMVFLATRTVAEGEAEKTSPNIQEKEKGGDRDKTDSSPQQQKDVEAPDSNAGSSAAAATAEQQGDDELVARMPLLLPFLGYLEREMLLLTSEQHSTATTLVQVLSSLALLRTKLCDATNPDPALVSRIGNLYIAYASRAATKQQPSASTSTEPSSSSSTEPVSLLERCPPRQRIGILQSLANAIDDDETKEQLTGSSGSERKEEFRCLLEACTGYREGEVHLLGGAGDASSPRLTDFVHVLDSVRQLLIVPSPPSQSGDGSGSLSTESGERKLLFLFPEVAFAVHRWLERSAVSVQVLRINRNDGRRLLVSVLQWYDLILSEKKVAAAMETASSYKSLAAEAEELEGSSSAPTELSTGGPIDVDVDTALGMVASGEGLSPSATEATNRASPAPTPVPVATRALTGVKKPGTVSKPSLLSQLLEFLRDDIANLSREQVMQLLSLCQKCELEGGVVTILRRIHQIFTKVSIRSMLSVLEDLSAVINEELGVVPQNALKDVRSRAGKRIAECKEPMSATDLLRAYRVLQGNIVSLAELTAPCAKLISSEECNLEQAGELAMHHLTMLPPRKGDPVFYALGAKLGKGTAPGDTKASASDERLPLEGDLPVSEKVVEEGAVSEEAEQERKGAAAEVHEEGPPARDELTGSTATVTEDSQPNEGGATIVADGEANTTDVNTSTTGIDLTTVSLKTRLELYCCGALPFSSVWIEAGSDNTANTDDEQKAFVPLTKKTPAAEQLRTMLADESRGPDAEGFKALLFSSVLALMDEQLLRSSDAQDLLQATLLRDFTCWLPRDLSLVAAALGKGQHNIRKEGDIDTQASPAVLTQDFLTSFCVRFGIWLHLSRTNTGSEKEGSSLVASDLATKDQIQSVLRLLLVMIEQQVARSKPGTGTNSSLLSIKRGVEENLALLDSSASSEGLCGALDLTIVAVTQLLGSLLDSVSYTAMGQSSTVFLLGSAAVAQRRMASGSTDIGISPAAHLLSPEVIREYVQAVLRAKRDRTLLFPLCVVLQFLDAAEDYERELVGMMRHFPHQPRAKILPFVLTIALKNPSTLAMVPLVSSTVARRRLHFTHEELRQAALAFGVVVQNCREPAASLAGTIRRLLASGSPPCHSPEGISLLCTALFMLGRVGLVDSVLYRHLASLAVDHRTAWRLSDVILLVASLRHQAEGCSVLQSTLWSVLLDEDFLSVHQPTLQDWFLILPALAHGFAGDLVLWSRVADQLSQLFVDPELIEDLSEVYRLTQTVKCAFCDAGCFSVAPTAVRESPSREEAQEQQAGQKEEGEGPDTATGECDTLC